MERIALGMSPTPLEPAPRLAEAIGLGRDDLWIKRDDLTGFGGGGNKVRKLERLAADALACDATVLLTSGGPQSNHARVTAAAARKIGLRAVLVLAADDDGGMTGNVALDSLLGAEVIWAGPLDPDALDAVVIGVGEDLKASGERPYVVPLGGSNALGAGAYLDAAGELEEQAAGVAHVVVAAGSGGTMAGLVAGLGRDRVLGVDVGAVSDVPERVAGLCGDLMGAAAPLAADLRMRTDQVGDGYGKLTPAARDALRTAARTEGLLLDPVYTGKALAGLIAAVADGSIAQGEKTVFVHTGGLPGLFGHAFAAELVRELNG